MKKLFLAMLLSSMAVVGLNSTHSETNEANPIRNEITAKRALSTNGAYDPAGLGGYANMAISDTADDNLYVAAGSTSSLKRIKTANLVGTEYGRSLELNNQSLVVRLTNVTGGSGMCSFSFKYKRTSANTTDRLGIRFSHRLVRDGDGVFYMSAPATPSSSEWQTYTYQFYDNYFGDDATLNLASYGNFIVDDFKFVDGDGINYFTDGDFEPVDILRYEVAEAGVAKQDDGSVIFGIGRTVFGANLGLAQLVPNATVNNPTVKAEWKGAYINVCNRNGYSYFGQANTDQSDRENLAKWQEYTGQDTKNPALPSNQLFFYTPNESDTRLLFVRNISILDESGVDHATYKLQKEDYADALADSILTYIDCNAEGSYDKANHLEKWNTMKWCFGIAPNAAKEYAIEMAKNNTGDDTFKEAIARYRIFVTNYGYSDFLGLGIKSNASLYTPGMLNDSSMVALYATLGFAAIGAGIATFLIVRKKKKA